ncbi:MAG: ATP-binding protein [Chloroflexi bacterium]|nr:ATP-binding protein [Chloroflexota bacterium]
MTKSTPRNPYIVGGWVTGPDFYGHADLRANLLHDANRHLWVIGTRRGGKTSLLRQLALDAGPEYVPLYWDMQGCASSADLSEELYIAAEDNVKQVEALGLNLNELENEEPRDQLRLLCRAAQSRDKSILLLIDEPETLIHIAEQDQVFIRRLRSAFQRHENLRVVMASTKLLSRLNDLSQDWLTSLFLQGFAPRNLSALEPTDSEALIRQTQNKQQVHAEDETVAAIQRHTNHHPFLVQWLCYRLFKPDGSLHPPTERDIRLDDNLDALFGLIYAHLSPTERRVLLHLSEVEQANKADLAEALQTPPEELQIYVYAMQRMGYIRPNNGQFEIGNSFLAAWLKRHETGLQVDDAEVRDANIKEMAATAREMERTYLEQQLDTYRVALARLELQRANYGMTAPLELENEIAFHERKIREVERKLDALAEV